MKFRNAIWFVLLLAPGRTVSADEFGVALGVFNLDRQGADLQLNYREEQSYWLYSPRYMQYEDLFIDPYSGREHSKTRESLIGTGFSYLFRNTSRYLA